MSMKEMDKKRNWKIKLAAGAAVLFTTAVFAMGYYVNTPVNRISLDVNPSIEIYTNRLDKVMSVKGMNEEGVKLLNGYDAKKEDLEDVIQQLVDRMVLQGYLSGGKKNEVLITVEDKSASQQLLMEVNEKIEEYLEYRNLSAKVMGQVIEIDHDLITEAEKLQVSVGKMSVIERLIAGDSTLTREELAQTRISEILEYAQTNGISLEFLEEELDDLEDILEDEDDGLEGMLDDIEDMYDDKDDDKDDNLDDKDDDLDDKNDDLDDKNDDLDDKNDDLDDKNDDLDDKDDNLDDKNDDLDDKDDNLDDKNDDLDDKNDDLDDKDDDLENNDDSDDDGDDD